MSFPSHHHKQKLMMTCGTNLNFDNKYGGEQSKTGKNIMSVSKCNWMNSMSISFGKRGGGENGKTK